MAEVTVLDSTMYYEDLGRGDPVVLLHETVAHLSIDLGSRGTVNVRSVPALSVEDLRAKLKGREQLAAAPVVGAPGTEARSFK